MEKLREDLKAIVIGGIVCWVLVTILSSVDLRKTEEVECWGGELRTVSGKFLTQDGITLECK